MNQHTSLIPIDVLVGNLAVLESNHNSHCQFHTLPCRCDTRKEPINRLGVGETDEEFLDDAILADGTLHARHLHVGWEELADEVVAIEGADAGLADAAGHGRNVIEMRVVAHHRHRGVKIARQLGADMLLEERHHPLLFVR